MKALLALFSLARFAGLFGGLAALPFVGPVLGIVAGFFKLVVSFLRWLVRDIEDAFREPQRLAVRTVCMIVAVLFGVYEGVRLDAHKVAQARAEVAQMKQIWKDKDNEDARRAAAAQAAREAAERQVRESAVRAPAAADAAAKRVQPKRAAAPAKSEPSLFGGLFSNPK